MIIDSERIANFPFRNANEYRQCFSRCFVKLMQHQKIMTGIHIITSLTLIGTSLSAPLPLAAKIVVGGIGGIKLWIELCALNVISHQPDEISVEPIEMQYQRMQDRA